MELSELKLDHFRVYELENRRIADRVALQSQFDKEPDFAELLVLRFFCNPVSKEGEGIIDKRAHLTWYRIYQTMLEPTRRVSIENQFGRQELVIGHAVALLAPAHKIERGSEAPANLDHYKLHEVLEGKPVDKMLRFEDQFGRDEARVLHPVAFGVPVRKHHLGRDFRIQNRDAHLLIYGTTVRDINPLRVRVSDQFLKAAVYVCRTRALAVPTMKHRWEEV